MTSLEYEKPEVFNEAALYFAGNDNWISDPQPLESPLQFSDPVFVGLLNVSRRGFSTIFLVANIPPETYRDDLLVRSMLKAEATRLILSQRVSFQEGFYSPGKDLQVNLVPTLVSHPNGVLLEVK